ncbi:MAG: hypothetical protein K2M05_08115, partial [Paramuribaculum sp.]|nr:hypothetical protein [Paramuribaculum sp.]
MKQIFRKGIVKTVTTYLESNDVVSSTFHLHNIVIGVTLMLTFDFHTKRPFRQPSQNQLYIYIVWYITCILKTSDDADE